LNKISNGKIWPYAIGISIFLVFLAAIATVVVANKLPVEKSDTYMMGYHEVDAKANELIQSKINFDKKYTLKFMSDSLDVENTTLIYKVTDKENNAVDNAKIILIVTRPNKHKYDQELTNPSIIDGTYTFSDIKLPLEGRWNVMAKVDVGDNERFYNVKMDTRSKGAYEY